MCDEVQKEGVVPVIITCEDYLQGFA